ncbi:MAG: hypothetical protein E7Z87_01315 [Cyanobacteria bacterium SIG26]|nr:hypothetical protein [Cyanobacteria bacterium SIG26]
MKRNFLAQFLNKLSDFPSWAKEILFDYLSNQIVEDNPIGEFVSYKPILTYKGRCELDFKKSGFDNNIYNILKFSENDYSISEISLNTYLSLEEVARYFIFCVDEGYFELPDNSQILNLACFLTGKYKTGEYFVNSGKLTSCQLESVIEQKNNENSDKKFGQYLIDLGFVTQTQLDLVVKIKEESKKRFVLDYHEIPVIKQNCSGFEASDYQKKIDELQAENKQLKAKLEQLLVMVRGE